MGQSSSQLQKYGADAGALGGAAAALSAPLPEHKKQLWRPTAASVQRGVFRSPEILVDSSLEAKTLQAGSPTLALTQMSFITASGRPCESHRF